ncbi:MAG: NADH-quinone oxidoreductase subunit J [Rhodanobacteraceae bacterium]
MTFPLLCFYVFAGVATLAALGVISSRNPVYAVLLLVLTFFSMACTWLLADAEFLGIALVVVYVGAVMVLFLFVVMMLDVKLDAMREGFARYLPVGIVVGALMLAEMLAVIGVRAMHGVTKDADPALLQHMSNTEWLGTQLFTGFLLPFEIAAIILTVGLIAAVTLTLRKRTGSRKQYPSEQVAVKKSDRVRVVKMLSEPRAGEAGE